MFPSSCQAFSNPKNPSPACSKCSGHVGSCCSLMDQVSEAGSQRVLMALHLFWWLLLGNIFHVCLLWFGGKSPLNCYFVVCSSSNVNQVLMASITGETLQKPMIWVLHWSRSLFPVVEWFKGCGVVIVDMDVFVRSACLEIDVFWFQVAFRHSTAPFVPKRIPRGMSFLTYGFLRYFEAGPTEESRSGWCPIQF